MVHRQTPIVSAIPGVHGNCDRLVFVIKRDHPFQNGDTVGFRAGYASRILSDPKGDLMPLGGHPAIQLVILAPSKLHTDRNGYVISPSQLQSASSQEDDGSFNELQWVKLGGSFEGQTQLVISVRDEHPFAAFSQVDAHGNLLVILDVAARAHGNVPSPAPVSSN